MSNSEILIRNLKLSILTDSEPTGNLKIVDEYLRKYFSSLTKYKSNLPEFGDMEFYVRHIDNNNFAYVIYNNKVYLNTAKLHLYTYRLMDIGVAPRDPNEFTSLYMNRVLNIIGDIETTTNIKPHDCAHFLSSSVSSTNTFQLSNKLMDSLYEA